MPSILGSSGSFEQVPNPLPLYPSLPGHRLGEPDSVFGGWPLNGHSEFRHGARSVGQLVGAEFNDGQADGLIKRVRVHGQEMNCAV